MTVFALFRCADCHQQYERTTTDEEAVERYKKYYPTADITKTKLVCARCYKIAIKALRDNESHKSWIDYAMSES